MKMDISVRALATDLYGIDMCDPAIRIPERVRYPTSSCSGTFHYAQWTDVSRE